MIRFGERRWLWLILVIYGVLAVIYSFATPPYETPDESYHVGMVMYIASKGELPVQRPGETEDSFGYFQEASQPPLYYFIQAQLIKWTGIPSRYYSPWKNPYAAIGIGLAQVNQRVYLPDPMWDSVRRAIFQMRWFSILLGAITLYAVYHLANSVFATFPRSKKKNSVDSRALLAIAFVAFNPMFIFIHASVTNDTLATTLATVGLALLFTRKPNYWIVGIVLALGAITKLSALTLYPVVAGVLLVQWLKGEISLPKMFLNGSKVALTFAVIAAWWYVRNLQLYGELTGTAAMIATIGARLTPYTITDFLNEMQGLRISGWALFGWLNVIGPDWFLTLMDVLTALALLGGIVAIARMIRARRWDELQPYGILGAYFLIIFVSLINWTRQTPGTQGRLLFPAIGAIAILVALGWRTIFRLPERFGVVRRFALALPVLPMLFTSVLSPFFSIWPAYAEPEIVRQVPPEAAKIQADFGRLKIVGVEANRKLTKSGELFPVTLYYGYFDQNDLSLYITIYDCQKRVIGKFDSLPGRGNGFTFGSLLDIYADRYPIALAFDTDLCQPLIEVGWYEISTKKYLQTADGKNSLLFRSGVIWNEQTHPEPPPQTIQTALFSGVIRLHGYTLPKTTVTAGEALPIRLNFENTSRIYEEFTVFYHLIDSNDKVIATGDAPPKDNAYPATAWIPNLPFNDAKTLTVPPGTPPGIYRIAIGFYRPRDLTRLPVDTGGDTVILNSPVEVK